MTFAFPGATPTEETPTSRAAYRVTGPTWEGESIECDYVNFTPTHITFWDDADPWDQLLLAVPLDKAVIKRIDQEDRP